MARSRTSENYLALGGRLDARAMLVTNKVTDSVARRSRKDPRKNA